MSVTDPADTNWIKILTCGLNFAPAEQRRHGHSHLAAVGYSRGLRPWVTAVGYSRGGELKFFAVFEVFKSYWTHAIRERPAYFFYFSSNFSLSLCIDRRRELFRELILN